MSECEEFDIFIERRFNDRFENLGMVFPCDLDLAWQAAKESSRKELEAAKQRIAELEEAVRQQKERCAIMKSNAQSLEQETREEKEALEKKLASAMALMLRLGADSVPSKLLEDAGAEELTKLCEKDAEDILRLLSTVKYLVGIAERGRGELIDDTETAEQFVLCYVKQLEGKIASLKAQLAEAKEVPDGWRKLRMANIPKPFEGGMRVIGFVVHEDEVQNCGDISGEIERLLATPTYKKEEA